MLYGRSSAVIDRILPRAVSYSISFYCLVGSLHLTELSHLVIIDESNLLQSEIFGDIIIDMIEQSKENRQENKEDLTTSW